MKAKYLTMPFSCPTILMLVLFLIASCPGRAWAEWSTDPSVNTPISTASEYQDNPEILSNRSGGAIIIWADGRSGNGDIYAQQINAHGISQWTAEGIAVCTADNYQSEPVITSDLSGGAIITWVDGRSGSSNDIYAQRINDSGTPQWTADGAAVCTDSNYQDNPAIISDGSGGAIIVWGDNRNGGGSDIYAQRINASGTPEWTGDGVAVCTASDYQSYQVIIGDGSGGVIIAWEDFRNGTGSGDIYAQRINASGTPQWTTDGVAVCAASNNQRKPAILSDGSGGVIISWEDDRDSNRDIYAQRINASGIPQWIADGVAVCNASGYQENPAMISDGSGGGIVSWEDDRNSNGDIYAQRINDSGIPQWTAGGVAVCTDTSTQQDPVITNDGSGGAIIAWLDSRIGDEIDIYVQRINASGIPQWTGDGVALCTASNYQQHQVITSDGSGGAISVWRDDRSGINSDIYAQQINKDGLLGVTLDDFPWELFYPAFIKVK